jgi:hypothetical protein
MLPASINEAQLRRIADVQFDPLPDLAGYTHEFTT